MDIFMFFIKNLHLFSELAACIAAVYYCKYLKGSYMKWVLPFLVLILTGELLSQINIRAVEAHYIIGVSEPIFYGYVFYNLIEGKRNKMLITLLMSVIVINYSIAFFSEKYYLAYYFKNLIFFGFLITSIALIYLYQLFRKEDRILMQSGFWMAFGISVFFSGISIVFAFYSTIIENNLNLFGDRLYRVIPRLLCIPLYGSIIVSIILYKKEKGKTYESDRLITDNHYSP
jgi:hypothetical protein